MWEYYFEPVSEITVEEALKSHDVISLTDNHVYIEDIFHRNIYANKVFQKIIFQRQKNALFAREVRLNRETLLNVLNSIPKSISESKYKVLGVIMRGTDLKWKTHSTPQSMIKRIKELMILYGYEYIFLATEEEEYLKRFQDEFGDRLLYIGMKRVRYDSELDKDKSINVLLEGSVHKDFTRSYLAVLYSLAKCDRLLSIVCCGAYEVAAVLNGGEYEICEIFELN